MRQTAKKAAVQYELRMTIIIIIIIITHGKMQTAGASRRKHSTAKCDVQTKRPAEAILTN